MAVAVSEGWRHLDSEDNDDDREGKHPSMVPWGGGGCARAEDGGQTLAQEPWSGGSIFLLLRHSGKSQFHGRLSSEN